MKADDDKMKVILLTTTVPETLRSILSGQPKWLSQFYEVHCLSTPGEKLDEVGEIEGVKVWGVSMNRGISPFRDIISIIRFCYCIKKIKPDIVHSYTPKAGLVAMAASFFCRVRIRIHTFTGLIFPTENGLKRWILSLSDKAVCFLATKVVPESNGVKLDLVSSSITNKPMEIIGNGNIAGVDCSYFCPGEYYNELIPNVLGFVFLFVGRLNKDKGLKELVSAFLNLSENCYLFVVGDIDESNPVEDAVLEEMKRCSRIVLFGRQHDVRPFYSRSDVLVIPSYREGFSNVMLEAAAMGVPVLATRVSGCSEFIDEGWNGWLVPPRNSTELEHKMAQSMAVEPSNLLLMGKNSRSRALKMYDKNFYLEKLHCFYEKLLY